MLQNVRYTDYKLFAFVCIKCVKIFTSEIVENFKKMRGLDVGV